MLGALLIVALLNLGVLVMPNRLAQFWDNLVPPEVVLAEPRPLRRHEEAAIASRLSAELHAQTDRLRRGFRLTVALSSCGLVLAAVGYVIEKSWPSSNVAAKGIEVGWRSIG